MWVMTVALLVERDAFFVLDLGLHVVDGMGGFDLKGNRLPRRVLTKIAYPPDDLSSYLLRSFGVSETKEG